MQIKVRVEGLEAVVGDFRRMDSGLRSKASKLVRAVSLALMKAVKREMPVDTGRARAGWGQWTPGDISKANPAATSDDAHWDESDGGLTISQGTNIRYVNELNQGSSQQADAGFIDKAVARAERELSKLVDELVKGL